MSAKQMKFQWTIVELQTFFYVCHSGEPQPQPMKPIVDAQEKLKKLDLIAFDSKLNKFRLTERGAIFLRVLCSTPIPQKKKLWVDAEGQVIS